MGEAEITRKLDFFFKTHELIEEESQAVYVMVELRKLLDHVTTRDEYTLMRFYCDWTLHTRKDGHLEHIAPIIRRMYESIREELQRDSNPEKFSDEILSFMYFNALRDEMKDFLNRVDLSPTLTEKDIVWHSFIKYLVMVLVDQPIMNPIDGVGLFMFEPSSAAGVRGRMDFTHLIHGKGKTYSRYTFQANF